MHLKVEVRYKELAVLYLNTSSYGHKHLGNMGMEMFVRLL